MKRIILTVTALLLCLLCACGSREDCQHVPGPATTCHRLLDVAEDGT